MPRNASPHRQQPELQCAAPTAAEETHVVADGRHEQQVGARQDQGGRIKRGRARHLQPHHPFPAAPQGHPEEGHGQGVDSAAHVHRVGIEAAKQQRLGVDIDVEREHAPEAQAHRLGVPARVFAQVAEQLFHQQQAAHRQRQDDGHFPLRGCVADRAAHQADCELRRGQRGDQPGGDAQPALTVPRALGGCIRRSRRRCGQREEEDEPQPVARQVERGRPQLGRCARPNQACQRHAGPQRTANDGGQEDAARARFSIAQAARGHGIDPQAGIGQRGQGKAISRNVRGSDAQ